MNNPKWFLYLFLFLAVSGFVCGIAEFNFLGPYGGVWSSFTAARTTTIGVPGVAQFTLPLLNFGPFFNGLWNLLWWNYAILLDSTVGLTFRFFFQVFSAAFLVPIILTFLAHIPIFGRGT